MIESMTKSAINAVVSDPSAAWVGGNRTYWPPQSVPGPFNFPITPINVQQKSDAPYIVATLAQLLDDGKISEDTFTRLVERIIQRGS